MTWEAVVRVADKSGYDEFVAARSPRLLRVAYLLTRDWGEAEDLLQTALMKAWFAWRRIDGEPDVYVRRIIATTFLSWRRRRWTGEISRGELPQTAAADSMSMVEDRLGLWPALGRLPKRQRAVIVLRYFEDLTEVQVAAELGITVGTVKSHTSRALSALRSDTGIRTNRPFTVSEGA
jgi:RNA polymerase sigma-70 factor (sigma-E family)